MKRNLFFTIAVVLLAACACKRETVPSAPEVTVPIVISSEQAKTYLDYSGGVYHAKWNNGDELAVIVDGTGIATSVSNTAADGQLANFTGTISTSEGSHKLQGFYPYSAVNASEGSVNVIIPSEQNPGWNTFDADADFLMARPVNFQVTGGGAVSVSTSFSRLVAVVKIDLQNTSVLDEGETVKYLTFTNSANVPVAGTFNLNLNEERNPAFGAVVSTNHALQVNFPSTSGSGSVLMTMAPCTFAAGSTITFTAVTSKGRVFVHNNTLESDLIVESAQEGKLTTFTIVLGSFVEPGYESGLYMSNSDKNWDVSTWESATTYNAYDINLRYNSTASESLSMNISAVTYDENSEKGWVSILSGRSRGSSAIHMTANTGMVRKAYLWGTIKKTGALAKVTLIQAPGNTLFDYMLTPTADDSKYGYGVSLFNGVPQNYGLSSGSMTRWYNSDKEGEDIDWLFDKSKYFRKYIRTVVGGNVHKGVLETDMTLSDWRNIYNGFSIEAIVKDLNHDASRRVILGGRSSAPSISLERRSTGNWGVTFHTSGGRQDIDSGIATVQGKETHIVTTINPSTHKVLFYIDGALAATKDFAGTPDDATYAVVKGTEEGGRWSSGCKNDKLSVPGYLAGGEGYSTVRYDTFPGEIYQVRVYKKVLTAAEVEAAYNVEVALVPFVAAFDEYEDDPDIE